MQGERDGSASSNASIDQQIRWDNIHNLGDKDLPGYMISAADTNTTFANSVYDEQRNLHRFNLGEVSSSGTKNEAGSHSGMEIIGFEGRRNDKLELNPLSSGNQVVCNVNLNAEYNEHLEDMNPVTGLRGLSEVNGLGSGSIPENSLRAGLSEDERRASCKRKAVDASIGQSSSSGGFRELQRGESSSRVAAPTFYSPANDLNISLEHSPRGLVSGTIPNLPALAITESSSRNLPIRVNPTDQQETVTPTEFSPGSVIRQAVDPSLNSPAFLPADQQPNNLRYGHAFSNFAPQNRNASAVRMPPVSRTMIPPFQWSGNPIAAGGSSSSAATGDRSVIHQGETRERGNILENPLIVPVPEPRNLTHSHISRNASDAGHVASSSSRTSVHQPPQSNPAPTPHQNHSPHNQRLSQHLHMSLLSSLARNQIAARSMAPPRNEHVLQSGGDNTSQAQNRAYSRAGPRQGQNAAGISHSLRELASTRQGRNRPTASEMRNVLDQMRRTGNLSFEDVMRLNQSIAVGVGNIHDRYRDMRLDVDNMTYEELLSLEERIGDVCTGLNDETISKKLKEQKYKIRSSQEVEPCCICQEEYKEEEDMGVLECGHSFHSQCIKEWLKQKNLCPICKTTGLNTLERSQEDK